MRRYRQPKAPACWSLDGACECPECQAYSKACDDIYQAIKDDADNVESEPDWRFDDRDV